MPLLRMTGEILRWCILAAIGLGIGDCSPCWGITLGQVDDFNDTTVMDWFGATPVNVSNGGSSGASGDHGLRIESGPTMQPRLLMVNLEPRWLGNWTAAGIERIDFDIRNPNIFDLTMRLGLAGTPTAGMSGSGDTYLSMTPVVIPAHSGWTRASFDVTPAGWQNFQGTNIATALTNVTHLRILHNPNFEFRGASVTGAIEFDNIRATVAGGGVDGDYNGDGLVNAADYTLWRNSLGESGSDLPADGDSDTMVTIGDYSYWKTRFGDPAGGGTAVSIPEPSGWMLAAMLLSMFGLWGVPRNAE